MTRYVPIVVLVPPRIVSTIIEKVSNMPSAQRDRMEELIPDGSGWELTSLLAGAYLTHAIDSVPSLVREQ